MYCDGEFGLFYGIFGGFLCSLVICMIFLNVFVCESFV